jgi:hypothetical protein
MKLQRILGSGIRARMIQLAVIILIGLIGVCFVAADRIRNNLIEGPQAQDPSTLVEVAHGRGRTLPWPAQKAGSAVP